MIDKSTLINRDPNIENQNILHINRLPPRTTVIPSDKRGVYYHNKYSSSRIRSLCGDYKFLYLGEDTYKNFYLPEESDAKWDTIDVPSMWQYRGYGTVEYPNVRYSFPFDPPYVKKKNPVGLYRRTFTVGTPAERTLIHFSGVDNAYYVYLNGTLVGFSKGSRLSAEFDVTSLIKEGENLLAVKVFTYSDASYLENQDMLLASGIFRDVYLIESSKNTLWDYRVTSTKSSITVDAIFNVSTPYRVRITLDGECVEYDVRENIKHTFELKNPRLWNAEEPNLYDLYIELVDGEVFETHSKRVGIMHSRIEGNKFLVNDRPIYVKGVNRHENDPWNGRTLTVEQIRCDLELIKANNLNAIRLSHYTNDPSTYEFAAELGLYLMDEADLETHGACIVGDQGYLSKLPEWFPAYEDRIRRMLETNKNEVPIFIWSTGNEAGRGENLERCIDIIREFDPMHECVITQDPGEYTHFRKIGYYPMSKLEEYTDDGHPVLAIEYAHAMGNSPGTLADYWDYNYTHEKMMGGFVWEFRSHGFGAVDECGRVFYKYGGDFEDVYHWSNFNLDGYCLSDGRPKPTWYELGTVSFAAYTTFDGEMLTVKNTNDFLSLSYLRMFYEIIEDGTVINREEISIPEVSPHESFTAKPSLTVAKKSGARYFIDVVFEKDGREVHRKQFPLAENPPLPLDIPKNECEVSVEDYVITVKRGDFVCKFDKGMLSYIEKGGKVISDKPMRLNLHRAYTDNDGIINFSLRHIAVWQRAFIRDYYFGLYDIDLEENSERVKISALGRFTSDAVSSGFNVRITYEILSNDTVIITVKGIPFGAVTVNGDPWGALPEILPRIGVSLELSGDYDNVKWLGRGPLENYPDSKANAPIGIYEKRIADMNFDYDVPQETGNREDTYCLTLTDERGECPISVTGAPTVSFSCHDMTLDNLTDARHKNEIVKSNKKHLYIDYRMRGLGSKSCGPDPEEKYELHPHSFSFTFALAATDFDGAVDLSRRDLGHRTEALSDTYHCSIGEKVEELFDCDI